MPPVQLHQIRAETSQSTSEVQQSPDSFPEGIVTRAHNAAVRLLKDIEDAGSTSASMVDLGDLKEAVEKLLSLSERAQNGGTNVTLTDASVKNLETKVADFRRMINPPRSVGGDDGKTQDITNRRISALRESVNGVSNTLQTDLGEVQEKAAVSPGDRNKTESQKPSFLSVVKEMFSAHIIRHNDATDNSDVATRNRANFFSRILAEDNKAKSNSQVGTDNSSGGTTTIVGIVLIALGIAWLAQKPVA